MCGVGDHGADGAEPDYAQCLAFNLRSDKTALALFHELGDALLALERVRPFNAADNVARGEEEPGQHELLDGVGVRAGRVEHNDALLRACVYRDIVYASASAGNRLERGGKLHVVQRGAADDNAVILGGVLAVYEIGRVEMGKAAFRNLVKQFNVIHRYSRPFLKRFLFQNPS